MASFLGEIRVSSDVNCNYVERISPNFSPILSLGSLSRRYLHRLLPRSFAYAATHSAAPRDIPPGRAAGRTYRSRLHPSLIPTCLLIPPPPLLPPVWAGRGLQRTTLLLHAMQRLLILCTSAVSVAVSSDRCVLGVGMGARTRRHLCRTAGATNLTRDLPKLGFRQFALGVSSPSFNTVGRVINSFVPTILIPPPFSIPPVATVYELVVESRR